MSKKIIIAIVAFIMVVNLLSLPSFSVFANDPYSVTNETANNFANQNWTLKKIMTENSIDYYSITNSKTLRVLSVVNGNVTQEIYSANNNYQLWSMNLLNPTHKHYSVRNKGNSKYLALNNGVSTVAGTSVQLSNTTSTGDTMWQFSWTTISDGGTYVICSVYPVFRLQGNGTKTIYVSYSEGNDTNNGLTESSPFKTLGKASQTTFSQGDQLLLKSNDIWNGETLTLNGSGIDTSPILLSSYATGNKPKISPSVMDASCVYGSGVYGWKIMNLELSNAKDGIRLDFDGIYNRSYLWIENCYIHDLDNTYNSDPYLYNHFSCGISINGYSPDVERYILSNITTNNIVFNNVNCSWWVGTPFNRCDPTTGFTTGKNTLISLCNLNNMSVTNGGQWGFSFALMTNATITNCDTYNTGFIWNRYGSAAIVVAHSQNVTLDGCDIYYARRHPSQNYDGVGFDFEGGINQYNITYKNAVIQHTDGAAIMVYDKGREAGYGTTNAVIDNVRFENFGENPGNSREAIYFFPNCGSGTVQNCSFSNKGVTSQNYFGGNFVGFQFTNNSFSNNLSDGKTVSASSFLTNYEASKAVDTDVSTYWSANGNTFPSWIKVDLGSLNQLTNVKQVFNVASVWKFRIEGSNDNSAWSTIVDNSNNTVSTAEFNYSVNATYRYVRLYIIDGGGQWATSKEFIINGTALKNLSLSKASTASSSSSGYEASKANDADPSTRWCTNGSVFPAWLTIDLGAETQFNYISQIFNNTSIWKFRVEGSNDNSNWTSIIDNTNNTVSGAEFYFPVNATYRYVRLYITNGNGHWATSKEFSIYGGTTGNIGLLKPTTASNSSSGYEASKANDGNPSTYWRTEGSVFPAWLTIDLSSETQLTYISQLFNNTSVWKFRIEGSNDNSNWTTFVDYSANSVSGLEYGFNVNVNFRYVRLYIIDGNGHWATSKEFNVYGNTASNIGLLKSATASNSSSGYEASKANDGNASTYWCTTGSVFPAWLTIDLGSIRQVTSIDQVFNNTSIWKFKVEVSNDNSTWTTIVDNTSNIVYSANYGFNVNVNCRYVRLYIIDGNGDWATSKEFIINGYN